MMAVEGQGGWRLRGASAPPFMSRGGLVCLAMQTVRHPHCHSFVLPRSLAAAGSATIDVSRFWQDHFLFRRNHPTHRRKFTSSLVNAAFMFCSKVQSHARYVHRAACNPKSTTGGLSPLHHQDHIRWASDCYRTAAMLRMHPWRTNSKLEN